MSANGEKKKGRTMTPELLEKLAKAREKGMEVIRAKREAKEKVKKEILEKTYEEMKKQGNKQPTTKDGDSDTDYSIKTRYDEEKPKRRKPRAEKPTKPVKRKIVYLTDEESPSDTSEEEEVVYVSKKQGVKKQARKPKVEVKVQQEKQHQPTKYSHYLSMF